MALSRLMHRPQLAALVVVAASLLGGCQEPPKVEEEVRAVRALTIGTSPTSATHTYAGEVRARVETPMGFRVPGKIMTRRVDVGAEVKAGQVLAQLDPSDLKLGESSALAQTQAAVAQFNVARSDYDRVRSLRAKGFASQGEMDRYETQFKAAKAQMDAAIAQSEQVENQTRYGTLVADADGVVTAVLAEAGQVVGAGQPVVQIARNGGIEVAAAIPEDRIKSIQVGMPVQVSLWSERDKTYAGRIRELSAAADPFTRTYSMRVTVLQPPPEMKLRMTASVAIPLTGLPDLIHLPTSALVTNGQKAGVWVFEPKSGTVNFRAVQVAGVEGNELLVSTGLEPGDVVVTAGAAFLSAGQKVRLLATPAVPTGATAAAKG